MTLFQNRSLEPARVAWDDRVAARTSSRDAGKSRYCPRSQSSNPESFFRLNHFAIVKRKRDRADFKPHVFCRTISNSLPIRSVESLPSHFIAADQNLSSDVDYLSDFIPALIFFQNERDLGRLLVEMFSRMLQNSALEAHIQPKALEFSIAAGYSHVIWKILEAR